MKSAVHIVLVVLLFLTGCVGRMQEESNGQTTVSKNEYREIDRILNYHYDVKAGLKKRMFFSVLKDLCGIENPEKKRCRIANPAQRRCVV